MTSNTDVDTQTSLELLLGRVKWFNNKAGYGFITVTDGPRSGSDIFIHHSAINVANQQYKYLVQGEYVEFNLVQTESSVHEFQASNVNGIKGGKLMCETRREFKLARSTYKAQPASPEEPHVVSAPRQQRVPRDALASESKPRQQRVPRARGEGPREGEEKKEWTLVSKKPTEAKVRGRPRRQEAVPSPN
jgi:CspA family cold shock protein